MVGELSPWLGDLHQVLPPHWTGIFVTVASILCGSAIGFERGRAQKPAGTRTLILICLGSAIFTQASILLSGPGGDRTRIASGIVTGIGFLGAGAIIRERGLVIGVTTGAAVWATAAVGVVLGSGYLAAGACFTAIILITLAGTGRLETFVMGPCDFKTLRLTYDPSSGKTRFAILGILDENAHEGGMSFSAAGDGVEQMSIRCCFSHRHHRAFLTQLMSLPEVKTAKID